MEVITINTANYSSIKEWDYEYCLDSSTVPIDEVHDLTEKLEAELKAAKRTNLSCGEVLLPFGLLERISQNVIKMAEPELCGIRGCTLHLNFQDDKECRRLSTVKCDQSTVSTFELTLTLKQSSTGWNHFLPQFLKKIAKGNTIIISAEYELTKNKLYRLYFDS